MLGVSIGSRLYISKLTLGLNFLLSIALEKIMFQKKQLEKLWTK